MAVVAAVDAVAHGRAQRFGNVAIVFDGEVADAAPRVQPIGRHDGAGGAGADAGAAAAAMFGNGRGGGQGQINKNLAQKKHRPAFAIEHQGVFAAPALAAAGGEFGFQHRCAIGEHAVAQRPHRLRQPVGQLLQALAQHLVVVAPPGVHRHHGFAGLGQAQVFLLGPVGPGVAGQIVHAGCDDAHGAGHQFGRARARAAVAGHIVHAAVEPGGQPGLQSGLGSAQVHPGHADLGESQLQAPSLQIHDNCLFIHTHP